MVRPHEIPKYKLWRTTKTSSRTALGIQKYMLTVLTQQTVIAFRNKSLGINKIRFYYLCPIPTPNLTINISAEEVILRNSSSSLNK